MSRAHRGNLIAAVLIAAAVNALLVVSLAWLNLPPEPARMKVEAAGVTLERFGPLPDFVERSERLRVELQSADRELENRPMQMPVTPTLAVDVAGRLRAREIEIAAPARVAASATTTRSAVREGREADQQQAPDGEGSDGVTSSFVDGSRGGRALPRERPGNPQPKYPYAAARRGMEGMVRVRLHIDASGAVEKFEIVEVTGHLSFGLAVREVVGRWRFEPGRAEGEPAPVVGMKEIRFEMEQIR